MIGKARIVGLLAFALLFLVAVQTGSPSPPPAPTPGCLERYRAGGPFEPCRTPTPCEMRTVDLAHLEHDHIQACSAADATATAYILVAVTATPCDPWADENTTPMPGSMGRLLAPCGVVAHDATWAAHDATRTAGIIDGSVYGLHYSNGAPNWTPTIYAYGTVPPEELAGYPATLTAMPQETPYGWRLDGDRWVEAQP